jgi:hypothetical protein
VEPAGGLVEPRDLRTGQAQRELGAHAARLSARHMDSQ